MSDVVQSALKFEESIMSILKNYCLDNGKMIYTEGKYSFHKYYDGYAPNGIFDDIPTIIEIKYSKNKNNAERAIKNVKFTFDIWINTYDYIEFSQLAEKSIENKKIIKFLYISLFDKDDVKKYKNQLESTWMGSLKIELLPIDKIISLFMRYPFDASRLDDLIAPNQKFLKSIKAITNESIKLGEKLSIEDIYKKTNSNIKLLKEKLDSGEITVVLGTGVSVPYGALSWNSLVSHLYKNITQIKFDDEKSGFKKIGSDNLSKVQYIKMELQKNQDLYADLLYKALYSKYDKNKDYTETSLTAICKMLKWHNIRKVITYNYDNYLEQILNIMNKKFSLMTSKEDYLQKEIPIYHVHGYIPYEVTKEEKISCLESIILSEDDYFRLYNNSNHWQVAIQLQSFKDDICLFIGNSITDYNEKRILNYTKQKFKKHYAIFERENLSVHDISKISDYYYETCNIEIIWVEKISDITDLISNLSAT